MAYMKVSDHGCYKVYEFFDMTGDSYGVGDDSRCPCCAAELDGNYSDLSFVDGIVQAVYDCPSCHATLTFNYYLANVIAE